MLAARVAVLVSGGGTNLQALLDQSQAGKLPHVNLALVIADKPGIGALERAERAQVPSEVLCRKDKHYIERLVGVLRENEIDMVVLAGFLGILTPDFFAQFKGPVINIHPSLIPSFCGKGFWGLHVHEAALAAGVKVTGATVHYVNEVVDGGAIIAQKAVDVRDDDTPKTLQRRVMEEAEWLLLPQVTEDVARTLCEKEPEARGREQETFERAQA